LTTPPSPALPRVAVTAAGARRLKDGLPWVFRKDLAGPPTGDLAPGFVRVVDPGGKALAVAMWARQGPLALRRWGPATAASDRAELGRRLDAALALRRRTVPEADAARLVHGEADDLPGLFVDRYADALVVQSACAVMEALLPDVVAHLRERLAPRLVVRRDDGSARDLESLPRVAELLHGGPDPVVAFSEGPVRLAADLLHGHKTGTYLDQRDNHLLAGTLAAGRALDVFACEGGFGLHLAGRADHVTCVEQDPASVERLRANAERSGLAERITAVTGNAFDVLRDLHGRRERFDTVVLDPPALAKRSGPLPSALRGYFELNRRALQLCQPGALLFTFSCSGRVTPERLAEVVHEAATACGRRAQVLRTLGAGPDHPGLLGLPEAEYLKGLLLCVS
jgi:23S rRNA (cytosine1962-C5)-methyltransferase